MRVALIDPTGTNKGLNIGLGLLAASLMEKGHQVSVVDLNNRNDNPWGRLKGVKDYDFIGLSIKSFTISSARRIAAFFQRNDIIAGGPHVTLDPLHLLNREKSIAYCLAGEAENTLAMLIESLKGGASLSKIPSLSYRVRQRTDRIETNPQVAVIHDLDALPMAEYGVFDSVGKAGIKDYPVITSRGCPHKCVYCAVPKISGRKVRFRSIGSVIDEIETARLRYGSSRFSVLDDNFTIDVARAKAFCRELIKRKVGMVWSCPNGVRADRLDEELLWLMRSSGCRKVSIGVESLNDEVFKAIQKGERLEDIRNAVALLRKHGIRVNGFFLIGLPNESFAQSRDSLEKCRQLKLDSALWNFLVPYPGTYAFEWVRRHGVLKRSWETGGHFGPKVRPVLWTERFTEDQMMRIYKRANTCGKNYSALFDSGEPLLLQVVRVLLLILRWDVSHIVSHIGYIAKYLWFERRIGH